MQETVTIDRSLETESLAQALIELESIQAEQDRRLRDNGVYYYTPNPIQSKAHNSKARIVIYCGGNRSGKSTFGAAELSMHTVGWYPDWFPQYRRFNRAIKAVVLATEFPVVERVIEPKLRSYMPKTFPEGESTDIKWKRSPQGYLQRLKIKSRWGGESVVDILTTEMDDMACESADWDVLWGDEPIQKSKFYAIQRGLIDRNGITILTFTPLIQPWMKTDLVDKSDGKKIECFISDIRDNKFDINGKTILNEESIQAFEDMLPDEIKETRIHGKFFHLQGVVYKEFSDVHLRKFDYEPGLPVICVLDPHDRTNHHVIWAFIDKTDDIKVFYELSKHCTLKELAAEILGVEEHFGFKMRARLIDPNFGRKPVLSSGKSVIEELSLCGVHFAEANDNIEAGQLKVKQYLHYNRNKPLDINNCPKIFFHKENVPLTIKSLRELQYDEWMGKTKGEKDLKETTKQKDTHGSDCTRYLTMWNPTWSGSKSYQPVFNEPIY